jgi:hypothetical protein
LSDEISSASTTLQKVVRAQRHSAVKVRLSMGRFIVLNIVLFSGIYHWREAMTRNTLCA